MGCFELTTGANCAPLIDTVRGCALWGATLEQVLPNGTEACHAAGLDDKADMEDFVLAFDSNLKPIVGQQVTLSADSASAAHMRLALLLSEAERGHCELAAHSGDTGYFYDGRDFVRHDGVRFSPRELTRRVIARAPVTFTAVPLKEGRRAGIDRDEDGLLDAFDWR
jgi:hypothetical protein